jgi:hypothetical protein
VRQSLGTVKGAFLVILGALLVVLWLLPTFLTSQPATPEHLARVRQYGPLVLVAYLVMVLLSSAGERAVSFSPAEVDFLFPGPFSRRQLLAYKLFSSFAAVVLTALLFTVAFRMHAAHMIAAFAGLVLALIFGQLLAMAAILIASIIGTQAYNRWRKVIVFLLAGVAAAVLFQGWNEVVERGPGGMIQVKDSPAWRVILLPFRVFVEAFTAEHLWPDLAQWAGLGLALDGLLLALVFMLDANYLESAAAAGERLYARMQRLRGGNLLGALPSTGKARFTLPALPWWGGIGPVAWRQLMAAIRQPFGLLYVFAMLAIFTTFPVLAAMNESEEAFAGPILAAIMLGMTTFLSPLIAFDFRSEVDRLDVWKSLPIAPTRLAAGQLVVPAGLVTVMEGIIIAAVLLMSRRPAPLLLLIPAFALPFNFLLFGMENLLFLWFPFRLARATTGDLQGMGRQMVFMILKLVSLAVIVGVVGAAILLAYYVPSGLGWWDSWAAALAVGWVVLIGFVVLLIPFLADALLRFDVSRDTPPA